MSGARKIFVVVILWRHPALFFELPFMCVCVCVERWDGCEFTAVVPSVMRLNLDVNR